MIERLQVQFPPYFDCFLEERDRRVASELKRLEAAVEHNGAEIARAWRRGDLAAARDLLEWTVMRALPSGVLAEQLHPDTGAPLSVSPLTWSHAAFVSTVLQYLAKRRRLSDEATIIVSASHSDRDADSRRFSQIKAKISVYPSSSASCSWAPLARVAETMTNAKR